MRFESIYFRGHRCFKKEWAGFDSIKPINVIIGRNNTGKSHLLDLVEALCNPRQARGGWRYLCKAVLDEKTLRERFQMGGGWLGERPWEEHGRHFVGVEVLWEMDENWGITEVRFQQGFDPGSGCSEHAKTERIQRITTAIHQPSHVLAHTTFRRLLADRDISPEPQQNSSQLTFHGAGATNIIRRYILSSNFPREIIQRDLLSALKQIFGQDGNFSEIQVRLNEEPAPGAWEVFFGEEKKDLVPLSKSGSGLKTVVLVLLNLLVVPHIDKKPKSTFTFAFEELENNVHPALQRRLLKFIENYAVKEKSTIFLTTHSSTALDVFGVSEHAQIIHVTHDGESAKVVPVSAHFDRLGVISELGAKPSDLLQANGIIWVEGPSDRIYLNRWIDLCTNGELREGRDYLCAFYGGALLARTQFKDPEEAEGDLVNLLHVNPNIVVVCDSDRESPETALKRRVERIAREIEAVPNAHAWVTGAKEIENYLPGEVIAKALDVQPAPPDPSQYESFFPQEPTSYVEVNLKRRTLDKMELALLSVPHMNEPIMSKRFDWQPAMKEIVERIRAWNQ